MSEAMFYVAFSDDAPGYYASCVDEPQYKRHSAKFVADALRKGHHVARVNGEEMVRGMNEWIKARKGATT